VLDYSKDEHEQDIEQAIDGETLNDITEEHTGASGGNTPATGSFVEETIEQKARRIKEIMLRD